MQTEDVSLGATVVGRVDPKQLWPVTTRWRAAIPVQGELQAPERVLEQIRPVPLSSRVERALIAAVRNDDGRAVLQQASEPGEHRTAAAVVAGLRMAATHPDRALRFLAWLREGPDDPSRLRFLRRYLPDLHILVVLDEDLGVAVPLSRTALDLLAIELLRTTGHPDQAEAAAAGLTPCAPVALVRSSLRLEAGDHAGVHDLAGNRPVDNDIAAAVRVVDARAHLRAGEPEAALASLAPVIELTDLAAPVQRLALGIRREALLASGREVEANLVEPDPSAPPVTTPASPSPPPEAPEPPLFGRTPTVALEDAWARVRRQPYRSGPATALDAATTRQRSEEVVALISLGEFDAAETQLLSELDRIDASVDAGGPVEDEFFVLLAGLFDRQQMTPEEAATLERLRAAHQRAGTPTPEQVEQRLLEARTMLDNLS